MLFSMHIFATRIVCSHDRWYILKVVTTVSWVKVRWNRHLPGGALLRAPLSQSPCVCCSCPDPLLNHPPLKAAFLPRAFPWCSRQCIFYSGLWLRIAIFYYQMSVDFHLYGLSNSLITLRKDDGKTGTATGCLNHCIGLRHLSGSKVFLFKAEKV